MSITTMTYAAHRTYLDPFTGQGLLVRPRPELDLHGPRMPVPLVVDGSTVEAMLSGSLQAADWNATVRHLAARGWGVLEEFDGLPLLEGWTVDGCEVIGLYAQAISSDDDMATLSEAMSALHREAGVTRLA